MSNKGHVALSTFDPNMNQSDVVGEGARWYSPLEQPFHVAGFAWFQQERQYRRLPSITEIQLPEAVDYLANHTSGGQIRFQTNSTLLGVRVKLAGAADMYHMPASGQCGVDCYIGESGSMEFAGITRYQPRLSEYESLLFKNWSRTQRNVVLNLPLYQGVEEIWIALDADAQVQAPPPYRSNKKVVVYGTSITQGGCASRPGMSYTNLLSRRIPYEFLNLGFSGSGQGEPEVAQILAQIADPALLVLDYEGNCVSTEQFRKTLPEFIRIYRETHPRVKILIPSRIRYTREHLTPDLEQIRLERKEFEQTLVAELRSKGDDLIYFHDGSRMLGESDFYECTVDGSHPNDLGFLRMADGLESVYKALL